ncbi:MAG: hypothetical protein CMJ49_00165 [Planctomycetaceae bacterium]|nr:hypothetical protein [Planctomycetaceae bacterium]
MRLGDALLEQGAVSEAELKQALAKQKATGTMLGEILVEQGVINPGTLVRMLAESLGIRGCHLRHGLIDPSLMELITEDEAKRLKAIPMFKVRQVLTVGMAEPQSLPAIDRLETLTGCRIQPVLALETNIVEFISKYAGGEGCLSNASCMANNCCGGSA